MRNRATWLAAASFTLLWVKVLAAQTTTVVDEATLMVSSKGAPVGRESFRITRATGAGGQGFRAVSTSALGDVRMSSTLVTDSSGAPVSYDLRATQRGQVQSVQGRGRPDRFSVLVQTRGGESAREYLMRRGTVLLDDEIFNQFYFVVLAALAAPDSSVSLISPREGSQGQARLDFRGIEAVLVGGQSLTARHFALQDGASTRAELWIDAAGRILKASVADKALLAVRDDPPR